MSIFERSAPSLAASALAGATPLSPGPGRDVGLEILAVAFRDVAFLEQRLELVDAVRGDVVLLGLAGRLDGGDHGLDLGRIRPLERRLDGGVELLQPRLVGLACGEHFRLFGRAHLQLVVAHVLGVGFVDRSVGALDPDLDGDLGLLADRQLDLLGEARLQDVAQEGERGFLPDDLALRIPDAVDLDLGRELGLELGEAALRLRAEVQAKVLGIGLVEQHHELIGIGEPFGLRSIAIDLRMSAERTLPSASALGLALAGAAAFLSPAFFSTLSQAPRSRPRAASTAALMSLPNLVASFGPEEQEFFAAVATLAVAGEAPFSLPALSTAVARVFAAVPAAVAASITAFRLDLTAVSNLATAPGGSGGGDALRIAEPEVERGVGLVERTDRTGQLGAFTLHLRRQGLVLADVVLTAFQPEMESESGILTLFMPSASRMISRNPAGGQ